MHHIYYSNSNEKLCCKQYIYMKKLTTVYNYLYICNIYYNISKFILQVYLYQYIREKIYIILARCIHWLSISISDEM